MPLILVVKDSLKHMNSEHIAFFHEWLTFLSLEWEAQKAKKASLSDAWNKTSSERYFQRFFQYTEFQNFVNFREAKLEAVGSLKVESIREMGRTYRINFTRME